MTIMRRKNAPRRLKISPMRYWIKLMTQLALICPEAKSHPGTSEEMRDGTEGAAITYGTITLPMSSAGNTRMALRTHFFSIVMSIVLQDGHPVRYTLPVLTRH